jgi:hypothetical protein
MHNIIYNSQFTEGAKFFYFKIPAGSFQLMRCKRELKSVKQELIWLYTSWLKKDWSSGKRKQGYFFISRIITIF